MQVSLFFKELLRIVTLSFAQRGRFCLSRRSVVPRSGSVVSVFSVVLFHANEFFDLREKGWTDFSKGGRIDVAQVDRHLRASGKS